MAKRLTSLLSLSLLLATSSSSPATAPPLTWHRHAIPITGQLVLTDVHAVLNPSTGIITAYASGEGGVLLKLRQDQHISSGGNWSISQNAGFPLYYYGVYSFNENSTIVTGFLDGSGQSYGIVTFTEDGGASWSTDQKMDSSSNWGGGPIEFDKDGMKGFLPSTSGSVGWVTSTGGKTWSDWKEVTPSPGNWYEGPYLFDSTGSGYVEVVGSADCTSNDSGETWEACTPSIDPAADGGIACDGSFCMVGGGEISPAVAGWVHVSQDGGKTYNSTRAFNAPYPLRTVVAVQPKLQPNAPAVLIAAGGNYFSGVGGIYSSVDGASAWTLDVNEGEEIKSCRTLVIPTLSITRVYCVSAGASGGSIYSTDI